MINCRSSKRAFNRSGAVSFNIPKEWFLVGFGILVLLTNLSLMGISGQVFGLILSFLNNRPFLVVLDGNYSQEYPVNVGVPQGSILGPTLFLLYINDFPDVTGNIAIRVDNTTLYSKCDQVSDMWQQLEMAADLESDLRGTVDWSRKWLVDFNAGKDQIVLFGRYNKHWCY